MFGKDHKGHEFEHLKTIYETNVDKLRSKIGEAQSKITKMHLSLTEIDSMMKKLDESRHEKKIRIVNFQKKFREKLDKEYEEKIMELMKQKSMTGIT